MALGRGSWARGAASVSAESAVGVRSALAGPWVQPNEGRKLGLGGITSVDHANRPTVPGKSNLNV